MRNARFISVTRARHERFGERDANAAHDMPWAAQAACLEADPELFFPDYTDEATARKAKAICDTCPVLADCLAYAIKRPALEGVWGRTTTAQRTSLRKQVRDE